MTLGDFLRQCLNCHYRVEGGRFPAPQILTPQGVLVYFGIGHPILKVRVRVEGDTAWLDDRRSITRVGEAE